MLSIPPASGVESRPREDHFVHFRGATWADYQRALELRGEHAVPRIMFLEGVLEIMTPSRSHESIKSIIGRLVEVWCLERNIEFNTYGSWTLEDKDLERGAEPDECYTFGAGAERSRPDLAIEVVWTSGGLNKLEVYRKLGLPELWYWRRGKIEVYVLRGGLYELAAQSEKLPGIDLEQLVSPRSTQYQPRHPRLSRDAAEGVNDPRPSLRRKTPHGRRTAGFGLRRAARGRSGAPAAADWSSARSLRESVDGGHGSRERVREAAASPLAR